MSRIAASFAALLLSTLAACGGGSAATRATPAQPTAAASDPSCPVEVTGTSVTVEDTATGAALVFITTGDVMDLRKRVTTLAQLHNEHHGGMGPLPTGTETGGGGHDHSGHAGDHSAHAGHGAASGGGDDAHAGHGATTGDGATCAHCAGGGAGQMGRMIGVHSKAAAEEIEGGAKLVLVAFPDGVGKLQGELRMHAQHLASGTCKMDHSRMDHSKMDHSKMDHSKMDHSKMDHSQTPAKANAPADHAGHH